MLEMELLEFVERTRKWQAEDQYIEVKAARDGCPKRLYDTLSAFSNQDRGGILLFGLDERAGFQICGVYDLQDLQKKVTEQCNQMEPPVRAVFTSAEIEGVQVCAAEIPGLDVSERPCYYRGTGRLKGSYIRVGDADLPMTDYEIYSYESYRKHLHDDEREVERAAGLLDEEKIERYIVMEMTREPVSVSIDVSTEDVYLCLPEDKVAIEDFMNFRSRTTGEVYHIQDDGVDRPAPPLQRDDVVGVGGAVEHLRKDVVNAVVQLPVGPAGDGGLGEVDGAEHRQHRQVFRPFLSRPVPFHQPLLGGPGDGLGVGRDFLGNQVQPELPPEEAAVLLPVAAVIDIPFLHPHRLDHIDRPPEGVLQLGGRAHLADKIDGIQLDRRLGVVEAGVVGEEDVAGLIALFPHPA